MPRTGPILELSRVTKRYTSPGTASAITVLNEVTLELQRGESLAIVGPSGSGKSTLLQIAGTLDRPTSGGVIFEGQDLGTLSEAELALVRNRRVGFVFQAHYLLPQCTVLENVLIPSLGSGGRAGEKERARAKRLLERVGLGHRLTHRPGELSGGEQQRVAVARALLNEPALLLADEPTGSLDHASAAAIAELLVELNQQETVTLMIVTHAVELARRMKKVLELKGGRLN